MKSHALVSHFKNNEIKTAYVSYDNNKGFGLSIKDKIYYGAKKMGLKSPVYILESGSGNKMLNELY